MNWILIVVTAVLGISTRNGKCSDTHTSELQIAMSDAASSISYLLDTWHANYTRYQQLLQFHFGTMAKMEVFYKKIKQIQNAQYTVICDFGSTSCNVRYEIRAAFVFDGSSIVRVCPVYFNGYDSEEERLLNRDDKARLLIHELAHIALKAVDVNDGYGQINVLDLAKTDPKLAYTNADSYAFFIYNAVIKGSH